MPARKLAKTEDAIAAKIAAKKLIVDPFPGADELESDEEAEVNRIGNVPLEWYKDEDHVGYTVDGQRIKQVMSLQEGEIDRLLRNADDPDAWRTILDPKNQTSYRLTDRDLEIIQRVRDGRLGVTPQEEETVEFDFDEGYMPLVDRPPRKGAFLPSKHEEKKILAIMTLMRVGKFYKPPKEKKPEVFDLWGENVFRAGDGKERVKSFPAPKETVPGHAHSYNPPREYLWTDEEIKQWHDQHPADRKLDFIPQAFKSLRHVPGYSKALMERFLRSLDLYLCPRTQRKNWVEDSASLLPELPPLSTFKPFPEKPLLMLRQKGSGVSAVCGSPCGRYVAAGCDSGTLCMYNIASSTPSVPLFYFKSSSRARHYAVTGVKFHPTLPILTFGRAKYLYICLLRSPGLSIREARHVIEKEWQFEEEEVENNEYASKAQSELARSLNLMKFNDIPLVELNDRPSVIGGKGSWRGFKNRTFFDGLDEHDDDASVATDLEETEDVGHSELVSKDWTETVKFVEFLKNSRFLISGFIVNLGAPVSDLDIHNKGTYIVTASTECLTPSHQCLLHSLRKKVSLAPLKRSLRSDQVRSAAFHPTSPWLCIGLTRSTKIFSLQKQPNEISKDSMGALVKKFRGADQGGPLSVYHNGEHLVRVTNNGRFLWYDFEYGSMPYKVLAIDREASLTSVHHHKSLPLIAVGSSLGHVQLVHTDTDSGILGEVKLTPLMRLGEKLSHVTTVNWLNRKEWLITGHRDGAIHVWA